MIFQRQETETRSIRPSTMIIWIHFTTIGPTGDLNSKTLGSSMKIAISFFSLFH